MTYTRAYTTWQDKPNLTTPVNAAILQNMEQGIYDSFVFHTSHSIRFVAGTGGSDSNDGLHPGKPYATIQAAYNSLGSSGGTIFLLKGTHSVGTGFVGVEHKIATIRSLSGQRDRHDADNAPIITGTGAALFTIGTTATPPIDNGWAFIGLNFLITNVNNTRAIQANDLNFLTVRDCTCTGVTSVEKYMVRSNHPLYDDVSWYRLTDNRTQYCGIADMASGEGDGNTNQHVIRDNMIFPGDTSWGMKLFNAQRCSIYANNIEGAGPGGIKFTGVSTRNYIFWNGGEGLLSPFLEFSTGSSGNVYFNYGSATSPSNVATNDLNGSNYRMGRHPLESPLEQTNDYTLEGAYSSSAIVLEMNKATAVTVTIPPTAVPWGIGKGLAIRQKGVGQVTVAPGSGVTLQSANGLKTRARYSVIYARKMDVNIWAVWGDTAP